MLYDLFCRLHSLARWLERRGTEPSVALEQRRHQAVIGRIVTFKAKSAARAVRITLRDRQRSPEVPEEFCWPRQILERPNPGHASRKYFFLGRTFLVWQNLGVPSELGK